jgi:hypothetical protein
MPCNRIKYVVEQKNTDLKKFDDLRLHLEAF